MVLILNLFNKWLICPQMVLQKERTAIPITSRSSLLLLLPPSLYEACPSHSFDTHSAPGLDITIIGPP